MEWRKKARFMYKGYLKCMLLSLLVAVVTSSCRHKDTVMSDHPIIALYSDFGAQDAYVSQLKGVIKTINREAEVMDLIHQSENFNTTVASYLFDKSSLYFPSGTIFVVVVDPGVGTKRKAVVIRTLADKIYVGPDNGIFTHVVRREGLKAAYEITNKKYFLNPSETSSTFHGRDIFGPVAAYISQGTPIDEMGPKLKPQLNAINEPTVLGTKVNAEIVHIDHYGNIITNIKTDHLQNLKPGQLIRITIQGKSTSIPFVQTYGDAPANRAIAIINSSKELEIAYPNKSAASILDAKAGLPISIQF